MEILQLKHLEECDKKALNRLYKVIMDAPGVYKAFCSSNKWNYFWDELNKEQNNFFNLQINDHVYSQEKKDIFFISMLHAKETNDTESFKHRFLEIKFFIHKLVNIGICYDMNALDLDKPNIVKFYNSDIGEMFNLKNNIIECKHEYTLMLFNYVCKYCGKYK